VIKQTLKLVPLKTAVKHSLQVTGLTVNIGYSTIFIIGFDFCAVFKY
jgi:hypothetical protein